MPSSEITRGESVVVRNTMAVLPVSVTMGRGDRGLRLETLICSSYDPLMDRHSSQLVHSHSQAALRLVSLASACQSKHALIWISVKIRT